MLLLYKTLWLSRGASVSDKVPEHANIVLKVNGAKVVRAGAFTVLMEAKDPEVIRLIEEGIKTKRSYKGPSKNIGVDWLNDFVVFTFKENKVSLTGISAHLKSKRLLYKNSKNYFDQFSAFAHDDEQIVILFNKNKGNNTNNN